MKLFNTGSEEDLVARLVARLDANLDSNLDSNLDASLVTVFIVHSDVREEDLAPDLDWWLDAFLELDLAPDLDRCLDSNLVVDLGYDLGCKTGLILDCDTDIIFFVGDTALDVNEWMGWISKVEFRELE